ncbi:ion transporter [Bergeyella sp. RCAD1439]|uniref:ion transporter n=1 Tax=Bergeyella anatis TaxID=3113737 RepID=UPI002E176068|nr:ion transporter [Bergeyella sp. RCAD1439]
MPQREHNLIPEKAPWKRKLFRIIYFADTPAGRLFDISLLGLITMSTLLVMMESMPKVDVRYHKTLVHIEWLITILFTIEYAVRIAIVKNKKDYIFSFMGIIDFLSILPFFLSLLFPFTKFLSIIRLLRILRVFRILNLMDYMNDGQFIVQALKNSSRKIYIFLLFIMILVTILGSLMYVVEHGQNGFTDIPTSIYWAVVTITTVGYGDISPVTPLGKFISVMLMLCGYSIIAVPTGIVTSQMKRSNSKTRICKRCGNSENDSDARYCKTCGERLENY